MPGIIFLNRRWNIASDDLFYPGLIELLFRSAWFIPQLFNYVENNSAFQCADVELLHIYYIGFLILMILILFAQFWIVIISTKGTITNTSPRRHMVKFLYLRSILAVIEVIWSIIGLIWLTKIKWITCSKTVSISVIANILFCGCAVFFLLIVLFIVFDPISHLPADDVVSKRNVLFDYLKKICCCCYCCLYTGNSRSTNYENSYKQISSILEMIFRNGDLTPSDIAAGIILLSNKELDQFNRESKLTQKYAKNKIKKLSRTEIDSIPKWMNINEAAYYIRYALATYSWPYYLYMHNVRGFCDLCCSSSACAETCCCCLPSKIDPADKTVVITEERAYIHHRHHLKAFKILSKIDEYDLIHANFQNELFLVPFCVLVDHFKKNIVITIRGTLSMRDVLTDMSAECDNFDFDDLREPCHMGIYKTAENIFNRLKDHHVLDEAFSANPTYQLVVTGHSLGAGTAVILALKLRSQYKNLKCIAYSPPGGLMSKQLAEYTKKFTMSVVVGDDIVSRLSLHSIHSLKADILKEIYNTDLPKYKIIWKYSMSFVKNQKIKAECVFESSDEEDEDDVNRSITSQYASNLTNNDQEGLIQTDNLNSITAYSDNDLSRAAQSAISVELIQSRRNAKQKIRSNNLVDINDFGDQNSDNDMNDLNSNKSIIAYDLIKRMMKHVKETYPELQLPGNILYIYRIKSNSVKPRRCQTLKNTICCLFKSCKTNKHINYDSRWASSDEFKKILITNRMLMDHFPNNVEQALSYFNTTNKIVV